MKRLFSLVLIFGFLLAAVSCQGEEPKVTTNDTTAQTTTQESTLEIPVAPAVNEGALKVGVYIADRNDGAEDVALILTLDGEKFVLADDMGNVMGAGSYALTDACYTMTYDNGNACAFVVQKDGSVKMTEALWIGSERADDLVFVFGSAIPTGKEEEEKPVAIYTVSTGTYRGDCQKGGVLYDYTVVLGKDGSFAYSVVIQMGESAADGIYMKGTYAVNGNQMIFTDPDGKKIEGTLTANDAFTISLKPEDTSSIAYEIAFGAQVYTLEAGSYEANYETITSMIGSVIYDYIARIGKDGSFLYYVTYEIRGVEQSGTTARGTYTLDGNRFIFTDTEGNVTEGRLVADNTLLISLLATSKLEEPFEVMFKVEP